MIAKVELFIIVCSLWGFFDYFFNGEYEVVGVGLMLLVPFGWWWVFGFVVDLVEESEIDLEWLVYLIEVLEVDVFIELVWLGLISAELRP